jgi:hypothetical protein
MADQQIHMMIELIVTAIRQHGKPWTMFGGVSPHDLAKHIPIEVKDIKILLDHLVKIGRLTRRMKDGVMYENNTPVWLYYEATPATVVTNKIDGK